MTQLILRIFTYLKLSLRQVKKLRLIHLKKTYIFLIILGIVLGIAIIGGVVFYFLVWKNKQDSASTEKLNPKENDVEIPMTEKDGI